MQNCSIVQLFNQKMVLKCVNVSSKRENLTAFRPFLCERLFQNHPTKLTISWAGAAWHGAAPDLGRARHGLARFGPRRAESGAHLAFEGTLAFENMSGTSGYVRISGQHPGTCKPCSVQLFNQKMVLKCVNVSSKCSPPPARKRGPYEAKWGHWAIRGHMKPYGDRWSH